MGPVEKAAAVKKVILKLEWCKGCGICAAFCPKNALTVNAAGKVELDGDKCSSCGICESFCPDFAIELKEVGGSPCRK